MEIKIIGSNNNDDIILRNRVLEAAMELNDKISISIVCDNDMDIKKRPAVLIDDVIACEGVITTKKISKLLKSKETKK